MRGWTEAIKDTESRPSMVCPCQRASFLEFNPSLAMLPSGLPEHVGDAEALSRFLTQSNQFNSFMAKPAAFLPNPAHRNTSVFRVGNDPARLQRTWNETATGGRVLKAVALFHAGDVRMAGLAVESSEPPPAHANIEGWPWIDNDPELQKA